MSRKTKHTQMIKVWFANGASDEGHYFGVEYANGMQLPDTLKDLDALAEKMECAHNEYDDLKAQNAALVEVLKAVWKDPVIQGMSANIRDTAKRANRKNPLAEVEKALAKAKAGGQ